MAEEDTSQEKTEEPTGRKIEKAREEGNVARSKELNTSAVLVAAAASFLVFGSMLGDSVMKIMAFCFKFDPRASWDIVIAEQYFAAVVWQALVSLSPIFIILLIASIVGPIGLGGWNISAKALAPKLSRMDPIAGLKRMFSMNAIVELLKSWGKVLVVAGVSILVLIFIEAQLFSMIFEPTEQAVSHAALVIAWSFLFIAASTIIIAVIDVPYQIYSYTKKLRMTVQEVKEEFKNTEGKPEVKAKIKQLQREIANRKMMADVPEADVIITNPTHFAVALKYKPNQMPAPILVAKGVDQVADKIREIGEEYKVPIVPIPPLARAVYYSTAIGREIPEGLYVAVAQVLAYVYQIDQWRRGRMKSKPEQPDYPIPDELRRD